MRWAKIQLETLWEQVGVVVVGAGLVHSAGDIAQLDGLRSYDAVHLAAAVAAQADVLATADRQLVRAARNRGFAVAQPR